MVQCKYTKNYGEGLYIYNEGEEGIYIYVCVYVCICSVICIDGSDKERGNKVQHILPIIIVMRGLIPILMPQKKKKKQKKKGFHMLTEYITYKDLFLFWK